VNGSNKTTSQYDQVFSHHSPPDIRHRVPSWSPPYIKMSSVAQGITTRKSVTIWRVGCFRCNKPVTDHGSFQRTSWIWPTSMLVVNIEPLSHWPGSMCSQPRPLESGFRSVLLLWRTFTNYVTHCKRLSRYKISWRSVSLTNGWQGGYCLAWHAQNTLRRRRRSHHFAKKMSVSTFFKQLPEPGKYYKAFFLYYRLIKVLRLTGTELHQTQRMLT